MILKKNKFSGLLILLILLTVSFTGCTSGLINHGFQFNAKWESPDIEILGYRYGNSNYNRALATEYPYSERKIPQSSTFIGSMNRGDDLYVKWKIKSTGVIYEDTVDLKKLMPLHIEKQEPNPLLHSPHC